MATRRRWIGVAAVVAASGACAIAAYPSVSHSRELELFRALDLHAASEDLLGRIESGGPVSAWHFLKEAYGDADGRTVGAIDPHQLAHLVGVELYASGESADTCDESFGYGCFHGFTEAFIVSSGVVAKERLGSFCAESSNADACMHGMGHALDLYYSSDLELALSACSDAFHSDAASCWDGAFMNNANWWPDFIADREWVPCDELPSRYGPACATSKASHALSAGLTYSQVADVCGRAATSEMVRACMDMLGYTIANEMRGNGAQIEHACAAVSPPLRDMCYRAASQLVADVAYPEWVATAKLLCERIEGDLRALCAANVDNQMSRHTRGLH